MISLDLVGRTPLKPRSVSFPASWPCPAPPAAPSPELTDGIEPLPGWLEPLAWKPKRRGKLQRFLAQMLVQLLVVNTLPPELQVASFALAVSPFWSPLEHKKPPRPGSRSGEPSVHPTTSPDPATPTAGGISEGRLRCAQCRRSDILLIGNTAVVSGAQGTRIDGQTGGAALVDFTDPENPDLSGYVAGVAGRLAVADGILFSSARNFIKSETAEPAVTTTALRRTLTIQACVPSADSTECVGQATIPFNAEQKTSVPVEIRYRVVPADQLAETIKVEILRADTPTMALPAPFDGVRGQTTWPAGAPVEPSQPYFVRARIDEGTPEELSSVKLALRITDIRLEIEKERQVFVAAGSDGRTLIADTWDESGKGLEPPINGFDYKNSSRTFTKAVATASGTAYAANLPDDYVILKINAGGAVVWEETGNASVRLDVPPTGRVEAKLKATRDLAAMTVERILITAEYYPGKAAAGPVRLEDDFVIVMNERLHGVLYNMGAAALGRGEGLDGTVVELGVGFIPFAGDAAGVLGEIVNAFDPENDVSKVNFMLSVVGFATEFSQVTGPIGVALDKGIVFLRVGLKRLGPIASGPLKGLPTILLAAAKARDWGRLAEFAEGSMKLAMVSADVIKRVALTELDLELLNRFVKRYSDDVLDTRIVERLAKWDEVYADPDAVRGAVRALGDLKDEAGNLIRLSDEAAEGAVKFMARAGRDLAPSERELLLKRILSVGPTDSNALLTYLKRSSDPRAAEGVRKLLRVDPSSCRIP